MYFLQNESLLDYNNFVDDLMYKLKAYVRLNKIRKKLNQALVKKNKYTQKRYIVSLYIYKLKFEKKISE